MSAVTDDSVSVAGQVVSAATTADLSGLMALEASFPEGQRWSEESWRGELAAENRRVIVCRNQSGAVEAAATFAMSADVVDLHRIVTSPTARRSGLARQLMDVGIAWAQEVGASRMLLEVEATNAAALSLYDAVGFRWISERSDYYGPGAHAVILERDIAAVDEGESS